MITTLNEMQENIDNFQYKIIENTLYVSKEYYGKLSFPDQLAFVRQFPTEQKIVFLKTKAIPLSVSSILNAITENPDNIVNLRIQAGKEIDSNFYEKIKELSSIVQELKILCCQHKSPYPFVTIPKGKSIHDASYITLNKCSVRYANSTSYSLTYAEAEKIWDSLKEYWALTRVKPIKTVFYLKTTSNSETMNASLTGIQIGCRYIPRHVMEELAIHRGWQFP